MHEQAAGVTGVLPTPNPSLRLLTLPNFELVLFPQETSITSSSSPALHLPLYIPTVLYTSRFFYSFILDLVIKKKKKTTANRRCYLQGVDA